jgi:hypothetical protein
VRSGRATRAALRSVDQAEKAIRRIEPHPERRNVLAHQAQVDRLSRSSHGMAQKRFWYSPMICLASAFSSFTALFLRGAGRKTHRPLSHNKTPT